MNTKTTHESDEGKLEDELSTSKMFSESKAIWLRFLFMVLFVFLYGVTRIVIAAVVIVQFVWALTTSMPNVRLSNFGSSLASYTYQMVCFLTFASEERPYPVDTEWPKASMHLSQAPQRD